MPTTAYAVTITPPVAGGFYVPVEVRFEHAAAPAAEPNPNPAYLVRDGSTPLQGRTLISDVTTFYFVATTAVLLSTWAGGDDQSKQSVTPAAYATPTAVALGPTSSGTPSADLSSRYVAVFTPEAYSGTTAQKVQATIDAAVAATTGGARGLAWLSKNYSFSGSGDIVTVSGPCDISDGGTLTVANSNGVWRSLIKLAANVSDVNIFGLTFDGNRTGNALTAGMVSGNSLGSTNCRIAISMSGGSNVSIHDNTFQEFDSTWVIENTGCDNMRVVDNTFRGIGNANSNTVFDHSTVYLDGIGNTVAGNTFDAPGPGNSVALNYGAISAIEIHGPGSHVHDNVVIGYLVGTQLASGVEGAGGGSWHDNTFYRVGRGGSFVPYGSDGFADLDVHHNQVLVDYLVHRNHPLANGGAGFSLGTSETAPAKRVKIHHNTITFKEGTYTGTTKTPGALSAGILWWRTDASHVAVDRDIEIADNTIVGAPDVGLCVLFADVVGLNVSRNVIRDAVSAATASPYNYGAFVTAYGYMQQAIINDNLVIDDQTASNSPYGNTAKTLGTAYYLGGAGSTSASCRARDNRVIVADGTGATFCELYGDIEITPTPLLTGAYYGPARASTGTSAYGANLATFTPITLGDGTLVRIGCEVTTLAAASTVRLGIYADTGFGRPGKLVVDAGTVAGTAVAVVAATISTPITAGKFWLCAVPQGGSPTLRTITGSPDTPFASPNQAGMTLSNLTGLYCTGISGALPSTAPSMADMVAAYSVFVRA